MKKANQENIELVKENFLFIEDAGETWCVEPIPVKENYEEE